MELLPVLLEKVLPPFLTGTTGAVGAVWRFTAKVSARIGALEQGLGALQIALESSRIDSAKNRKDLEVAVEELRRVLTLAKTDIEHDVDEIYSTLKARAKEQADLRRIFNKLTERYLVLETRVEAAETAVNKINESLKDFMQEQHEQWQQMSKALGQIEGYLRGISRRSSTSGSFPPTK